MESHLCDVYGNQFSWIVAKKLFRRGYDILGYEAKAGNHVGAIKVSWLGAIVLLVMGLRLKCV